MPKILIICTGNSCRSIMGEALINARLGDQGIRAFSAGSHPSGHVNPHAIQALMAVDAWKEHYHSKTIEAARAHGPFDLVITVCDRAKESCPVFPSQTKTIHVGFEDPDGKPYAAFVETRNLIENRLLSVVRQALGDLSA
jgi:arsenate reductase